MPELTYEQKKQRALAMLGSSGAPDARMSYEEKKRRAFSTMSDPVSKTASFLRGGAQGATIGFGDEAGGLIQAGLGAVLPESFGGYGGDDKRSFIDRYRAERDAFRKEDEAAEKAHPGAYLGGQIVGGIETTAVAPSASVAKLVGSGAAIGAAGGIGGSKSENISGMAKDALVGGSLGAAGGAAGAAAANIATKASRALRSLGQGRLFKAAVGQNKRAFVQVDGKGLLDKAGAYLDGMGIGTGDSTESIARKLAARDEAINDALGSMVGELDMATASPVISAKTVADRIEKEVAAPLKRIAANRDEYAQVMKDADAIREIGDQGITFTEAALQRRAVQQKINYDKRNGLDAAADAKNKIAKIWNEVIDEHAEPILKGAGKAGDAYKELRHEAALVKELLGHSENRVSGNLANRWASPSDYGAGAIGGIMSGNPVVGMAAATANHLARRYGSAAAGRAAINMARFFVTAPPALRAASPVIARNMQRFLPDEQGDQ